MPVATPAGLPHEAADAIQPRLDFLDGLRGFAALVVVANHVFCNAFPFSAAASGLVRLPFFNGTAAVGVFFLLSGFSLTVAVHRDDLWSPLRLAAGRYVRLAIPVLAASAIMYVALVLGFVDPLAKSRGLYGFEPSIGGWLGESLFGTFFAFSFSTTYLAQLWTMPVELGGSLFIAALSLANLRPRLVWPLYGAALVVLFVAGSLLALFVVGAILSRLYLSARLEGRVVALTGAVMIGAGLLALAIDPESKDRLWMVSVSLLSCGLLVIPGIRGALGGPIGRHLGRWSFSIYLMHATILTTVGIPLMVYVLTNHPGSLAVYLLATIPLAVLSALSAIILLPVDRLAISASRWCGRLAQSLGMRLMASMRRLRSLPAGS